MASAVEAVIRVANAIVRFGLAVGATARRETTKQMTTADGTGACSSPNMFLPRLRPIVLGLALTPLACSTTNTIIERAPDAGVVSVDEPVDDAGATDAQADSNATGCGLVPGGPVVLPGGACGGCFAAKCATQCAACVDDAACKEAVECEVACGDDANCAYACTASLSIGTQAKYDAAMYRGCAGTKCADECYKKKDLGDTCYFE